MRKVTEFGSIIFVHGLGSNPDTTWLAKASLSEESTPGRQQFMNWVSDFLPEDLQASQRDIRMFFYNYDSYWKKDAVRSRLMTLGNELLEDIHGKIIVSETALIQAQMSQRSLQIVDRTKAILFLGTPHRGTSIGTWGWILAQALRPLGSNPLILADLGYDGFPLQDLHRHFIHATRDDPYVFNFFEKLPTVLFQLWFFRWQQFYVQEQSATYQGKNVRNIGLSVDHYGLNKFGCRLGGYDMVKSKLVEVCERSTRSPRRYYHVPLERCAVELQLELPKDHSAIREPVFEDPAVLAVNLWLHDRLESDEEWLVIVDNADDVSWGVRKIIPKGRRGSLIITSQDNRSVRLVNGACERVHVGLMSGSEGVAVLLKHIRLDTNSASTNIQQGCSDLAKRLGLLALAIDLAGACIGNDPSPQLALFQYLADYERHYTELLRKDDFRGLRPTEKTVWTVWDATIERISKENMDTRPDLLLTFIAQFKGGIVEEEMFRLASLGMAEVNTTLSNEPIDGAQYELQQFLSSTDKGWDDFKCRQAREALVRYNLLQKVEGHGGAWPGVSMHSLNLSIASINNFKDTENFQKFAMSNLGMIYFQEGRGKEAEELLVPVMTKTCTAGDSLINLQNILVVAISQRTRSQLKEAEKTLKDITETFEEVLGEEHQATLDITHELAITYVKQARFQEAEELELRVMKTIERTLGQDNPLRISSMANLAVIYAEMGRKKESNKLFRQIAQIKERSVALGHGDLGTLQNLSDLGTTYLAQGRLEGAEKTRVKYASSLAASYMYQGRLPQAEQLLVQLLPTMRKVLGEEDHTTLGTLNNLATTYHNQGRRKEAKNLLAGGLETMQRVFEEDSLSTLTAMNNLAVIYLEEGK
ncbi:kinesin [Colletotrichum asianum]|uniref:Kinesin n=1 Tax=Colletotrichum asianum TaxID=702518 RepID=A0A8H3W075_9PEZI|nr:kinesin [Colletotrichum asianum]